MEKYDYLVLGNASANYIIKVDQIPADDTTIYAVDEQFDRLYYGGTGHNIAYSFGKLGCKCQLLTSTDEVYGMKSLADLKEVGVNTDYVRLLKGKALCYLLEAQDQRRLTVLGRGLKEMRAADMPDELFEKAGLCVFSIDHQVNVDEFMKRLRETDSDYALAMRSDRKIFNDEFLRQAVPMARIIFANEKEGRIICEALNINRIEEVFEKGKTKIICLTRGAHGADIYLKDGQRYSVPAIKTEIADTIGAGDGFAAGFLYGYKKKKDPQVCGQLGCTLASFIIEKEGCTTGSPTEQQLLERWSQFYKEIDNVNNSKIRIVCNSIVSVKADAIVNAANSGLRAGGGVCGAIFEAAGYHQLQEACDKLGRCHTGQAVITPGFRLAPYIIHAVGPIYQGGNNNERELLESAYRSSLDLAWQNNCHSICFPLISAGIYGYPQKEAWEAAIKSCRDWLKEHEDYDIDIIFAVLDNKNALLGESVLNEQ